MKTNFLRIVSCLYVFLAFISISSAQTKTVKHPMQKIEYKWGDTLTIKLKEPIRINDSVSITLTYFTHKRPYPNGPTKATAYVSLSTNASTEEVGLSVHGVEGQRGVTYDTKFWEGYRFQLKEFFYNKAIKVMIDKKEEDWDD